MKITFLGTSHGVPARGRNCTSMMIEEGDGIYFIDGGAPLIEEFLKIKEPSELAKVRGIFTTHAHSDHTFGILHMASLMDWFYKLPLDIYLTETGVIDAMKNLYSVSMSDSRGFNPELIRFHLETPDFVYEDENIKLSLIRRHTWRTSDVRPTLYSRKLPIGACFFREICRITCRAMTCRA